MPGKDKTTDCISDFDLTYKTKLREMKDELEALLKRYSALEEMLLLYLKEEHLNWIQVVDFYEKRLLEAHKRTELFRQSSEKVKEAVAGLDNIIKRITDVGVAYQTKLQELRDKLDVCEQSLEKEQLKASKLEEKLSYLKEENLRLIQELKEMDEVKEGSNGEKD